MFLDGQGGDQNVRQAARWFKLAARKGHVGAQAEFGHMLFEGIGVERRPVEGLMWLSIAQLHEPGDPVIQARHEQAFSTASEEQRREAMAMAETWISHNTGGATQAQATTAAPVAVAKRAAFAARGSLANKADVVWRRRHGGEFAVGLPRCLRAGLRQKPPGRIVEHHLATGEARAARRLEADRLAVMRNDAGTSARAVRACRGGGCRNGDGRGESQDLEPHTGILARLPTMSSGVADAGYLSSTQTGT